MFEEKVVTGYSSLPRLSLVFGLGVVVVVVVVVVDNGCDLISVGHLNGFVVNGKVLKGGSEKGVGMSLERNVSGDRIDLKRIASDGLLNGMCREAHSWKVGSLTSRLSNLAKDGVGVGSCVWPTLCG